MIHCPHWCLMMGSRAEIQGWTGIPSPSLPGALGLHSPTSSVPLAAKTFPRDRGLSQGAAWSPGECPLPAPGKGQLRDPTLAKLGMATATLAELGMGAMDTASPQRLKWHFCTV